MRQMPTNDSLETLIRDAVRHCISKTNLSFDSYAAGVREHYLDNVPEAQQTFTVPQSGDIYSDCRKLSKKLDRYFSFDAELKLPVVLLPSLIAAMPDPYKKNTITKVFELIDKTEITTTGDHSTKQVMNSLMKESNEALQAYLKIAWNGLADDSVEELNEAKVELLQLMDEAEKALGLINGELESRSNKVTNLKVK